MLSIIQNLASHLDLFALAASKIAKGFNDGFSYMGAIFLIMAVTYPAWEVFKTKKTYGINDKLLIFLSCTAFNFLSLSLLAIINNGIEGKAISESAFDIAGFIANTVSFTCNLFVYKIKSQNMKAAKVAGLSEMDYFNSLSSN